MLTTVEGLPEYVYAMRAVGEVTGDEVEKVLIPSLQALVDKYDEIYYLLILETKVENFSAGAWVRDMFAGLKHFTKWKKIAVVTNQLAVKKFTDAFSYITPAQTKGFSPNDLDEALIWISLKVD